MPLTTEQMQMIVADLMLEREPRVTGQEADSFRTEIADDIELAKEKGWEVVIPPEWEVDTV